MIPSKIKIGAITYNVIETNEDICLDHKQCRGIINYSDAQIKIDNKCDEQVIAETFWHEVVHGIVTCRNLELGEDEETTVDEIGKALHQLFVDNNIKFFEQGGMM